MGRDPGGGTVAGVNDNLEGHGNGDVMHHLVDVGLDDILLYHAAVAPAEVAGHHPLAQLLDAAGMDCVLVEDDFQAVVQWRIVAAGNHDT